MIAPKTQAKFNALLHPRYPKGHPSAGKFMKKGGADYKAAVKKSLAAGSKNVKPSGESVNKVSVNVKPSGSASKVSVEESTLAAAKQQTSSLQAKYLKKEGTFSNGKLTSVNLNTDEWRDLFPEYKGTNAAVVQEASSFLNKSMYQRSLKELKGSGNNTVVILAGGGGSGKGTATQQHLDLEKYPIKLDQVSGSYDKTIAQLKQAKDAGFKVEYNFIDRDPKDAWDGVTGRAVNLRKKGQLARTVPLEIALKANLEARDVAIKILERNPEIPVKIINNNNGFGLSSLITDRKEALSYLRAQKHDYDSLYTELKAKTKSQYKSGKIPTDIAIGLLGEKNIRSNASKLLTKRRL